MTTRTPSRNNTGADEIRLQRTLYVSRNPTRKWLHQSRWQWILAAVRRYFPESGGVVLDAGTGCGFGLSQLSGMFQTVIALDIRPEFLGRTARPAANGFNLYLSAGDLRALPVRSAAVDLVICSEVLEHITADTICLREIYRALKPGGLLILSTPQPFSLPELTARIALSPALLPVTRRIYGEAVRPLEHINLHSLETWRGKLRACGFTLLETHRSGLYLPVMAELFGQRALALSRAVNAGIAETPLAPLLWTQFFVAGKQNPPRGAADQK